jgi:hypothetical protein
MNRTISIAKRIDPEAKWIDHDTVGPFASGSDAVEFVTAIGRGSVVMNGHGWNVSFHRKTSSRQSFSEKRSIRESAATDLLAGMRTADVARKYGRTYVWAFRIGQSVLPKQIRADTIYTVLSLLLKTNQRLQTIANRVSLPVETVQSVYDDAIRYGVPLRVRS